MINGATAGGHTRIDTKKNAEPQISHFPIFKKKRDLGGKPKSLSVLPWCRRGDSNNRGSSRHPPKHGPLYKGQ
jgi:hypothetical protein